VLPVAIASSSYRGVKQLPVPRKWNP